MRPACGSRIIGERGQMTVELCVVIPVCLIVAVIVMNGLCFFADCARFDRVSRNAVRTLAASPSDDEDAVGLAARIGEMVEGQMADGTVECRLAEDAGGIGAAASGYVTYELVYRFAPTLFGLPMRGSVFGVTLPELSHTTHLSVDSYTPGKLLG